MALNLLQIIIAIKVKTNYTKYKNASKNVGIEHKSYHLFMTKTIQNIIYTFETNDGGSTKEIVELQEKCINSIHEINNPKNS